MYNLYGETFGFSGKEKKERKGDKMKSFQKITTTLILTMIIFLSIARVPASAARINVTKQELEYFKAVSNKSTASYYTVKLYLGSTEINEITRSHTVRELSLFCGKMKGERGLRTEKL